MKCYIVASTMPAYFQFVHRLFMYGYIDSVSKERQILIIDPLQVYGLHDQIIFLLDGFESLPKAKEIHEALLRRKAENTVFGCSPVITKEAFAKLILSAKK